VGFLFDCLVFLCIYFTVQFTIIPCTFISVVFFFPLSCFSFFLYFKN
jgi:hypothetical protein